MPRRRLAAVPDRPQRVALYVRVSALMGRGGDDFHSPDIQVGAMRRLTAGLREVAVVDDIDQTGRHFSRAGINRIRAMAESGTIDAVAVYDVSRLGRNVRESLTFLSWLADRGVTVLSACERVDTSTPAGRLMLTNMLAIAEYRSDEIGRGWSTTIASRAARGRHHGQPLGYRRASGALHVDPVMGPVIAKAWRDYASDVPIAEICRAVAAARGRRILATNLKKIFRNVAYLGHTTAGGQVTVEHSHPALVDTTTWDRVQQRLVRDSTTPSRHLQHKWSLVGLVWCPWGHRLQQHPRRRRDGVREIRLCCGVGPTRGVGGACPGIGLPLLDRVESEVLRQVAAYVQLLRTDDAARAERLARQHTDVLDLRRLHRELGRVQDAVTRLARARALGDLDDDELEYRRPVAELHAEAEALRARIADAGEPAQRMAPTEAASAAQALLQLWPDMTPAERGRALRDVVARITVRRAAYWREPESDRVSVDWR